MSAPATNSASALVVPASTNAPAPLALRDIRPPIPIANPWFWVAVAAAAIIAFLLGRWGWRKWRAGRESLVQSAPLIPPHIRARERLQAALRLIQDPTPFCTEVADILRTYLDERFDLHASDRTTEEFLEEMRHNSVLHAHQKAVLGEFLTLCDLAKFARHEPTLKELERLHGTACQLVDETEPSAPAPSDAPADGAPNQA